MNDKAEPATLFGIKAIADHGGMTERQASYRAELGQLPTFKMGRTLCASRAALDAWLAALAGTVRKPAA